MACGEFWNATVCFIGLEKDARYEIRGGFWKQVVPLLHWCVDRLPAAPCTFEEKKKKKKNKKKRKKEGKEGKKEEKEEKTQMFCSLSHKKRVYDARFALPIGVLARHAQPADAAALFRRPSGFCKST